MINQKWILTARQYCDLEMLLIGGFDPLSGFLSQADYESVVVSKRLKNGAVWPIPITLDVSATFADSIAIGDEILLCHTDNSTLARMRVTDKWKPCKHTEAHNVYSTEDTKHPAVNELLHHTGEWYLGGPVELVTLPAHYDFSELRLTPRTLKKRFAQLGCQTIIGFQTRNPIHRAHMELTLQAAELLDGHILIHPVVGLTKPGDIDYFTRVRCYQKILHHYPEHKTTLSLLPLAMRMAGPREALWHAIIRKNYGCTHFIVGRDHAGPGNDSSGKPFYDPYAAQEMVQQYQHEIGIQMVPFQEMVYVKERKQYCPTNEVKPDETALNISGTELRHLLLTDKPIPHWFSFPEIIDELRQSCRPTCKQGFTVFFTGLSGAGKTTLAQAFMAKLMTQEKRSVSILDGDVVRRILASELGFTKADRNLSVSRIGFVASEITKAGGIVLCAAIAPYTEARAMNRKLISQYGGYIEVYVSTSLAVCENRDTKGLYSKVRNGQFQGLTGVDDPYESPLDAEITIDTAELSVDESINKIMDYLVKAGYLKAKEEIVFPESDNILMIA